MTEDTRQGMLFKKIIDFSTFEQVCDVLILGSKPHIDVKLSPSYGAAMMYGAGAAKITEMLKTLDLQSGVSIQMNTVGDILPMPREGFTPEELAAVDLSGGDAVGGPNGETVREMITQMYHCQTEQETEWALRRFLAS